MTLPRSFLEEAARSPNAILFETSRFDAANHGSYLFLNPTRLLVADELDDIPGLFSEIERALAQGLWVAGYLCYECGYHFERFIADQLPKPLAWFGVYEQVKVFDHFPGSSGSEQATGPQTNEFAASEPIATTLGLEISKESYVASILKIKAHLAAGDTYQVNFTDRFAFESALSPVEVFSTLSAQQRVAYSAFLNIQGRTILSFSPELFFKTQGDGIITRPMKGTMPRGLDFADDERMADCLRNDAKNRSEHVMIVDLLRNDLGRICRSGTVEVQDPFAVERYETLHQMTSTVLGCLKPGISFYDIIQGLFPSGSITGAPKHRTMQIIRELERQPRGVYTGAIGFISPTRSSVFNVAIRTLVMQDGRVTLGVGGGIVADSDPEDEYRECLLKTSFVTRSNEPFRLIETMLWDGEFKRLSWHLDRMESSALYFGFPFDRCRITSTVLNLAMVPDFAGGPPQRVRLTLTASGRIATQVSSLVNEPFNVKVWLTDEYTSSADPFRRHKTTRRKLYDRLYKKARTHGFEEVIFSNERDEITEGAISNVFVRRGGKLLTPPLASGILPGVFRRHILETRGNSEEAVLTLEDLHSADDIFLCSSLRGLRRVVSFSSTLNE
jgi:para-aminobenzoate synthetase/4-amino-4-deoxychorismate lyase